MPGITLKSMQNAFKTANVIRERQEKSTRQQPVNNKAKKKAEYHIRDGVDFTDSDTYYPNEHDKTISVGISATKGNYRGVNDWQTKEELDPQKMKPTENRAGAFTFLDDLQDFTEGEIGQCLYDLVCRMMSLVAQNKELKGDFTLIMSLVYKGTIYTVNRGNSSAFFIAKDKPEDKFSGKYCNVLNNVSSAADKKGINQIPTVSAVDFSKKTKPTLVIANAGVGNILSNKDIASIYNSDEANKANWLNQPVEQAKILRCIADVRSPDNDNDITSVVVPLEKQFNTPLVAFLAGGYEGSEKVSEYIKENLAKELKVIIEQKRSAKSAAKPLIELADTPSIAIPKKVRVALKQVAGDIVENTSARLRDGSYRETIQLEHIPPLVEDTRDTIETFYRSKKNPQEQQKCLTEYEKKINFSGLQIFAVVLTAITASLVATPIGGAAAAYGLCRQFRKSNEEQALIDDMNAQYSAKAATTKPQH